MRKIASLVPMLMLLCIFAFGQTEVTVTGQVRDEKGEPIAFATIIEAGHRSTTVAAAGGIDTAKLTLAAGPLPLAQVNEPF